MSFAVFCRVPLACTSLSLFRAKVTFGNALLRTLFLFFVQKPWFFITLLMLNSLFFLFCTTLFSFFVPKQTALIALLSEKADADQLFADNARAADQAHSALEQRLKTTADALRVAEERFRTLEQNNFCRVDSCGNQEGCTEPASSASAAILTSDRASVTTFNESSSPLPTILEETHQSRDPTEKPTLLEEAEIEGREVLPLSSAAAAAAILDTDCMRAATATTISDISSSLLSTMHEERHQSRGCVTDKTTLPEEARAEGRAEAVSASAATAITAIDQAREATDSEQTSSPLSDIPEKAHHQSRGATEKVVTLPEEAKANGRIEAPSASALTASLETGCVSAATATTNNKKLSSLPTVPKECLLARDTTDKTALPEEVKIGRRKEDPSAKETTRVIGHARAFTSTTTTHSDQTSSPFPAIIPEEIIPQSRDPTEEEEEAALLEEAKTEGRAELPPSSAAAAATAILETDRSRAGPATNHSHTSSSLLPTIPEEIIIHQFCNSLDETTLLLEATKAEVETLRAELGRAQEAERAAMDAATKERGAAEQRVTELESVIEEAEREREKARSLADERLEKLGEALEQEERERGMQVRQRIVLNVSAVFL